MRRSRDFSEPHPCFDRARAPGNLCRVDLAAVVLTVLTRADIPPPLTISTHRIEDEMSRLALSFVALLVGAAAAHAHTGIGDAQGFAHGFAHPAGGIDHGS